MLKITRNLTWVFAGNTATAAAQWGIVVILTRFSGPEVLGAYVLGLSVSSVSFALANLELRTLFVTDQAKLIPFATYFKLRAITGAVTLLVLGLLAWFWPYSNDMDVHGIQMRAAIVAVALVKSLDGFSDVIYAQLQSLETMTSIGQSQLGKAILSLCFLGITLAFVQNQMWAIGALVVPSAFVLLFHDLPILRIISSSANPGLNLTTSSKVHAQNGAPAAVEISQDPGSFRGRRALCAFDEMMSLVRTGIPLAIVTTMVMLHSALPRFVVAGSMGKAEAGIMGALTYAAIAPNLLMVALGQSSVTTLVRSLAEKDRKEYLAGIFRLLVVAIILGSVTLIFGFFLGERILHLLYGQQFLGHENELLVFLGASAVGYVNTALGYGLSSSRVFAAQIPMMASVCLICFAASVILVPRWGLIGAAAAQLISMTAQLVLSAAMLASVSKCRFEHPFAESKRIEST